MTFHVIYGYSRTELRMEKVVLGLQDDDLVPRFRLPEARAPEFYPDIAFSRGLFPFSAILTEKTIEPSADDHESFIIHTVALILYS